MIGLIFQPQRYDVGLELDFWLINISRARQNKSGAIPMQIKWRLSLTIAASFTLNLDLGQTLLYSFGEFPISSNGKLEPALGLKLALKMSLLKGLLPSCKV